MLAYKTKRYIRKLAMRNDCIKIKAEDFLNDPKYKDMHVWDLKYISTSDEEDNDSEESDSDEDSKSHSDENSDEESDEDQKKSSPSKEEKKGSAKKIWKEDVGDKVPDIAKKLRPAKKKQRVYDAYT